MCCSHSVHTDLLGITSHPSCDLSTWKTLNLPTLLLETWFCSAWDLRHNLNTVPGNESPLFYTSQNNFILFLLTTRERVSWEPVLVCETSKRNLTFLSSLKSKMKELFTSCLWNLYEDMMPGEAVAVLHTGDTRWKHENPTEHGQG